MKVESNGLCVHTSESYPSFQRQEDSFEESTRSPWQAHHASQPSEAARLTAEATFWPACHSLQRRQLFHHPSKLSRGPETGKKQLAHQILTIWKSITTRSRKALRSYRLIMRHGHLGLTVPANNLPAPHLHNTQSQPTQARCIIHHINKHQLLVTT